MTLLSNIFKNNETICNYFNKNKNKILYDLTINIEVSEEEGFFCYYYFSNFYFRKFDEKLKIFKELNDNIFINDELKINLQNIFCKLQKTYFAFLKIYYLWKYKKAVIQVNHDLSLNPIDINKKNVFILFQENSKYLFTSNDLINIINTNLSNSPGFFCNPLSTKNPYNNIILSHCDLYNIYFFLKYKVCNLPILFELFFKSNFDLKEFAYHNECVIRSIKIDNFVKSSDNDTLYKSILKMIKENSDIMHKIKIDKDFPKDLLIKIMRPYLNLYIISKFFIIGTDKRNLSLLFLRKKIYKFAKFNPNFGRKKLKINEIFGRIIGASEIIFDDRHINFYNDDDDSYDFNEEDNNEEDNNEYYNNNQYYNNEILNNNINNQHEDDSDDD